MKKKIEHRVLFDNSGCLTQQAIALFIDGQLSESEIRHVKKHSSNCELCADALEGAEFFHSGQKYHKRIDQMHQSLWRHSLDSRTKSRQLFYGISSAAASIVILLGVYFVLKFDRVVKEEFDLNSSGLVLSESENTPLHTEKQTLVVKGPKSETEALKKKEIENRISEDLKTIEEPSEKLNIDVGSYGSAAIIDETPVEETKVEIIVDEDIMEEEVMRVEFNSEQVPVVQDVEMKANAAAPVKKEMLAEMSTQEVNEETSPLRKSRSGKLSESQAYYIAEVTPMFQGGGLEEFNLYLQDKLKVIIPDSAMVQSIIISFVVDSTGNINKVKLITGTASEELNDSIVEYIKSTPVWVPAYKEGKAVNSEQQTKVVFDTVEGQNKQNIQ